jgi:hypothetical protein
MQLDLFQAPATPKINRQYPDWKPCKASAEAYDACFEAMLQGSSRLNPIASLWPKEWTDKFF